MFLKTLLKIIIFHKNKGDGCLQEQKSRIKYELNLLKLDIDLIEVLNDLNKN